METNIALKNLKISPRNVRVVSPSKDKDKQLIASIAAHGLLQNLVVIPTGGETGIYEVVAGGRRFGALTYLLADGQLADDYEVPCKVKDAANATEYSIAENKKEDMHPADLYASYKELTDQGRSVKEIAIRFGRTQKEVKQILRLADVAPVIFESYRQDSIDLDVVMAFTVSDDIEKQEAVYRDMAGGFMSAHMVKSRLVNTCMDSKSPVVKYVTLKAYESAGGTTSSDLFDEVKYIDDDELMQTLAEEKMASLAESIKSEGWKWVETTLSNWLDVRAQRVEAELVGAPVELVNKLKDTQEELEKVTAAAFDEEDDDKADALWEKESELEKAIENIESELDSYRVFTDEQKQIGGAVITLKRDGTPEVTYGYVRREDMPQSPATTPTGAGAIDSGVGGEDGVSLSQALRTDLANYELLSIRSVLMSNPDLCFDLAAFTLAKSVLSFGYYERPSSISLSIADMSATKDIEDTKASIAIHEAKEKLNITWLESESELDMFINFQMLTRAEKKAIHSFCVAASVTSSSSSIIQSLAEQMKFNLADHWQPTNENYFNRIRKDDILEVAKELKGEEYAEQHKGAKKGDLAKLIAELDEVKGWLPKHMS